MAASPDPFAVLRTRSYLGLLVLAGILGVPISAGAWGFLYLVDHLQQWIFSSPVPGWFGFHAAPIWWPVPCLALAGLLVAPCIRYLPGRGGHSPADGFQAGGVTSPIELPGVFFAAVASLALGVVIGPEAPLIALGGGLAAYAVKLAKRDVPARTSVVVASAGSFAAISALFGSPILAAFLLMEASGLGGATMELVLLPGLTAAGVGTLVFIGLGSLSGLGTFSLVIPDLPHFTRPNGAEFGWAIVIGLAAALLGTAIHRLALFLRPLVERRMLALAPVVGLAIAGLAVAFAEGTGKSSSEVLFSGQNALGPLLQKSAAYSLGALVLLVVCKALAYGASLSSFRGGPTFPAMFVGAAGGIALSHAPGLPMVAGAAMGIGAMSATMLKLPLTSVLLATLLLLSDGIALMPLVIVSVVVAYVLAVWLSPRPRPETAGAPARAPAEPKEMVPASPH